MTKQDYVNAISHMLEGADIEALRLIWIATRNLPGSRKKVQPND